jgi:hypothetical protein
MKLVSNALWITALAVVAAPFVLQGGLPKLSAAGCDALGSLEVRLGNATVSIPSILQPRFTYVEGSPEFKVERRTDATSKMVQDIFCKSESESLIDVQKVSFDRGAVKPELWLKTSDDPGWVSYISLEVPRQWEAFSQKFIESNYALSERTLFGGEVRYRCGSIMTPNDICTILAFPDRKEFPFEVGASISSSSFTPETIPLFVVTLEKFLSRHLVIKRDKRSDVHPAFGTVYKPEATIVWLKRKIWSET